MQLFHDREYRPFPREHRRDEAHGEGEVPLMAALLELPRGARILELGCGPGGTLSSVARLLAPSRLAGIDIDRELLARAAERLAEAGAAAELVCGDARALPFPDASFEIVLDFGTLYHIARSADALAEAARVLVPGGMYVTETRINQALSHPIRSLGRSIPWRAVPELVPHLRTLMWDVRVRR
jgi:ubiquinone/menaquinone biosynthesis C-methylase UbiE